MRELRPFLWESRRGRQEGSSGDKDGCLRIGVGWEWLVRVCFPLNVGISSRLIILLILLISIVRWLLFPHFHK